MGITPSFPRSLFLHVLSRERESRSLKLLLSPTDWMPALHHTRYRARLRGHDKSWHSLAREKGRVSRVDWQSLGYRAVISPESV
jgi:hypothetical protein